MIITITIWEVNNLNNPFEKAKELLEEALGNYLESREKDKADEAEIGSKSSINS